MKENGKHMVEVICLRVCGWCQELLGFGKVELPEDKAGKEHMITHGICEDCQRKVLEEIRD